MKKNSNNSQPAKVLVAMSDTGGGHRAAAEAIQAAADRRYPGELEFNLVDVFRYYTPVPFRFSPEIYPAWVNYAPQTWYLTYAMTNGRLRSKGMVEFFFWYWQRGIRRMLREHPADLVLAVHSIINRPVMKAIQEIPAESRPPCITVVTDLVSTHAFWYEKNIDRCLVASQPAYDRGLEFGLTPEQLRITGLPVHPKFIEGLVSKTEARQELGLDADLPAVLLVSGGEGMGPLYNIAEAINQKKLPCQLLIVAGRNDKLRGQLNLNAWNQPTHIYGFVDFMPRLMAAADMVVTKAGPATICEACMAGLPIIISGAVPGQEEGNIDLVVQNDIGVFAPSPQEAASTVEAWLRPGSDELQRRSKNAKAIARPDAVWDIVDEIHRFAHFSELPVAGTQPASGQFVVSPPYINS